MCVVWVGAAACGALGLASYSTSNLPLLVSAAGSVDHQTLQRPAVYLPVWLQALVGCSAQKIHVLLYDFP